MLGSLAPLPLRLGGPIDGGLTAAGHARIVSDLIAASANAPLCRIRISRAGSAVSPVVRAYSGRNGSGLQFAPQVLASSGPDNLVKFRVFPRDPVSAGTNWTVKSFTCQSNSSATTHHIDPNLQPGQFAFDCSTDGALTFDLTFAFYGTDNMPRVLSDYDGDLNKINDLTENPVPYAAGWYQILQDQRGSSYTAKPNTFVHVENLALARIQAAVCNRYPDKLRANSVPNRADEGLPYWQAVLGVTPFVGESKVSIRSRCSALYAVAPVPSYGFLRDMCATILGPMFSSFTISKGNSSGDLSAVATNTYWPGINPGLAAYSLGGGAWYSDRCSIVIGVTKSASMTEAEYDRMVNVALFQALDRTKPAWTSISVLTNGEPSAVWDGFAWDDGTVWGALFDWIA